MRKIIVYMAVILMICTLSSCGSMKVKDEDSAYSIMYKWMDEHEPLSGKDSQFVMDTNGGLQTQIIDGDTYYSSAMEITYRNKNYLFSIKQGHECAYENLIANGTMYVRERDGSIYVAFAGEMEPIDEWYASFDDWIMSVVPVGYDRFIIAPTVYDFVNITDYSDPYREGWEYELMWDSMNIAKGYEVEYIES